MVGGPNTGAGVDDEKQLTHGGKLRRVGVVVFINLSL